MSHYTLNDDAFDLSPLTLYIPTGDESKLDEVELQKAFKANRELMQRMELEYEQRKKPHISAGV